MNLQEKADELRARKANAMARMESAQIEVNELSEELVKVEQQLAKMN